MNDITALMATMKAAAEKAKHAGEAPVMPFDTRITALNEFQLATCPANVLALVGALEKARTELAKANGVLDKIKSTSCHVDTSEGSFIPNSLDAWGRPVPQHLPYDFSGNPGASATQYCNGWNDAGGYWLNYIRELESRTVTVKLPDEVLKLAQAPQHLSKHDQLCWMSGANWMRMEAVKLNPADGIQVIEGE